MPKETFYTARYDAVFKNALACESEKDLLKEFLEKVLHIEITELTLNPKELEKPNVKIRTKTLDVLLKTQNKTINLEINNGYYESLPIRNYAYIASVFSNSVFKGENYDETREHIQLNITWGLGKSEKNIVSNYVMYDKESDKIYCDKLKIMEINMDKLKDIWYHGDRKKALEYKYFLMLDLEPKDLEKISKGDKLMKKFKDNVEKLNSDPEFIEVISPEKDAEMVYNTLKNEARAKGLKEGLKEGKEEGLKKGHASELAEGQHKKAIETAKKMLEKKIDIDTISECTGLSKEDIEKL